MGAIFFIFFFFSELTLSQKAKKMEDEAFLSDGSDSAIELLDSEEDEPHSEEAYVASDVTDDGEDEDLPAGGGEYLASQDDENEAMDSLGVAAVVSLPVPDCEGARLSRVTAGTPVELCDNPLRMGA